MTDNFNLEEYAVAAQAVLPPAIFDFIRGGSGDEVTLRANRAAFDRWRLVPRVLVGFRQSALATTVLGQEVALPVLVSPMGLHRMAHVEGELASARATRQAGTILSVSTAASWTLEEIGAVGAPWWFQLYVLRDRGLTEELVRRAEAAGAAAVIVTVDVTVRGRREANERNRFEIPAGVTMPNLVRPEILGTGEGQRAATYVNLTGWEPAIDWGDIAGLASLTPLPLLVKGSCTRTTRAARSRRARAE
jgi:4-hydroxymandelate oxidase